MSELLGSLIETTPKRVFLSPVDWPGLARGARHEAGAIEALLPALPRYAPVAEAAGEGFRVDGIHLEVVERIDGDAGTDFGMPEVATALRRPPDRVARTRSCLGDRGPHGACLS